MYLAVAELTALSPYTIQYNSLYQFVTRTIYVVGRLGGEAYTAVFKQMYKDEEII